jgi:signal peptide peptidase SppA
MSHTQALAALLNRPMACDRQALENMHTVLSTGTAAAPQAVLRKTSAQIVEGGVGVLPIVGILDYRPSFLTAFFGGTAITDLREELRQLLQNRQVHSIVLHSDSPGGSVDGLDEFSYELREARRVKPLLAMVDTMSASAAYYLCAQADEIILTSSGQVGSVGCYILHVDSSQALEMAGVRPTYIHAAKFKVEGNELEPLTSSALRHLQAIVDQCHAEFVDNIVRGRGRGLTADQVKKRFGEGRMVKGADAVTRGMADRIFNTTGRAFAYVAGARARGQAAEIRRLLDETDSMLMASAETNREFFEIQDRVAARYTRAHEPQEGSAEDLKQRQADQDAIAVTLALTEGRRADG